MFYKLFLQCSGSSRQFHECFACFFFLDSARACGLVEGTHHKSYTYIYIPTSPGSTMPSMHNAFALPALTSNRKECLPLHSPISTLLVLFFLASRPPPLGHLWCCGQHQRQPHKFQQFIAFTRNGHVHISGVQHVNLLLPQTHPLQQFDPVHTAVLQGNVNGDHGGDVGHAVVRKEGVPVFIKQCLHLFNSRGFFRRVVGRLFGRGLGGGGGVFLFGGLFVVSDRQRSCEGGEEGW